MQGMISGALSSAISTVILYPWEKIRIEMQTHSQREGIVQTVKRLIHEDQKMMTLYKGLKPFLIGNILSYALYFLFYEKLKVKYPATSILNTLKISAIAGTLCSLVINPFWVLQTSTAVSKKKESMAQAAIKMIQSDGFKSLWKGLSSSLILVSNPIIQYSIYEWLKKSFAEGKTGLVLDVLIFLFALLSKAAATFMTYPYTVIRTYQHLNKSSKSVKEILTELYQDGGILRFFKGMSPKLIQTMLNSALMLVLYERMTKFFLKIITWLTKHIGKLTNKL